MSAGLANCTICAPVSAATRARRARRAWRSRESAKSGKLVIEAEKHRQDLWRPHAGSRTFRSAVNRGDRIGILGPNGAGKTTLIKNADRGVAAGLAARCGFGANLEMASIDQKRAMNEDETLGDYLTDGPRRQPCSSAASESMSCR